MRQGDKYQEEEWDEEDIEIPDIIQESAVNANRMKVPITEPSPPILQPRLEDEPPQQEATPVVENVVETMQEAQQAPAETSHQKGNLISKLTEMFKDKGKQKLLIAFGTVIGVLVISLLCVSLVNRAQSAKKQKEEEEIPAWMQEDYEPPRFEYTPEEVASLRLNGYTGSEIEQFEEAQTDADELIQDAKDRRTQQYEEEIAPYLDAASDEYKELASDSWVGQESLEFSSDVEGFTYYNTSMNVDYKKLPARGNQLYLKLILRTGAVLFMNVTPEQYVRLEDDGNIVVQVEYVVTSDGKEIVTGIQETKIAE